MAYFPDYILDSFLKLRKVLAKFKEILGNSLYFDDDLLIPLGIEVIE